MRDRNDRYDDAWCSLSAWPSASPSIHQLRRMLTRATAEGKPPVWARRLPTGRWAVNPAIFWAWIDETQAANQRQAQAAP